jgi:hypothetical protein
VTYFPTDAEATTGNDDAGAKWFARITKINLDGSVNLAVLEGDGGNLAKTSVSESDNKGGFSFIVVGGESHAGEAHPEPAPGPAAVPTQLPRAVSDLQRVRSR